MPIRVMSMIAACCAKSAGKQKAAAAGFGPAAAAED